MKKFSFLKRMGRCLLVLAVLFALVGADAAPLAETAEAVTQSDIDALKDNADDLADQKSEIKSQLASLRDEKANILAKRVLLDQQIAVTEKEIANTENQIAGYEALLAQTALELEENQKEEEERSSSSASAPGSWRRTVPHPIGRFCSTLRIFLIFSAAWQISRK